MAEIVNLNRIRKARAKEEKDRQAAANRQAYGRTKAEKLAEQQRQMRDKASLDGHKLDPEPD